MDDDKKKDKASLSAMVGGGEEFEAQGKAYYVFPLKLYEVDLFLKGSVRISDGQIFNIYDDKTRKETDKWLREKVLPTEGGEFSLDAAMKDQWDLDDLKNCLRKIARLSG